MKRYKKKIKEFSKCLFRELTQITIFYVKRDIYFFKKMYFFFLNNKGFLCIKDILFLLNFLLSSIYIRIKYWIRENFRLPVFNGFTCFEMS